jgi:beta-mannosidase
MTTLSSVLVPLRRRPLSAGWSVWAAAGPAEAGDKPVPASVPGVVHLDLLAAGVIPDPYLDDNEAKLAWIGLVDWTYETSLAITGAELAAHERHELVFDGLDTVATVLLNGDVIADVANQHRSYRIDVTDALREGRNTLTVAFRSPVRYANAQSVALGVRQRPYPLPYEAIRKSACSFGWDWGIATSTSGIWRPVTWDSWSLARLDEMRVHAEPDGDGGVVRVTARVARTGDTPLQLRVSAGGQSTTVDVERDREHVDAALHLDAVERWWPAGHGAQPLYDVEIALLADGEQLDAATRRVGFRTLRWDTTPDASGTPFQLVVNDRPIFVKGVNWIPDDAFPSRVDRARYRDRLTQARAANLNLVRVWGGGIYESDDFYDLCDELGLLTWQDFLFACAAYAEEEPLRSEVEAEARENVARIAHHASLALLTGNNENLWGFEDWGWKLVLDGKTWGAHYYYEMLPGIVSELAPHVPYAPGSPFSPGGEHPNAEDHGSMHLWEQWNRQDWPTYREHSPRFVAEFGWQGPPAWTTLTRAIHDDPLTPESPGMIVHQKAIDGNVKLTTGLVRHYRVPEDMETWHWAMQLNQANAVSCALDWFRAGAPHTAGAVIWQLNDCWPVTSWAAVDGDGREKPLFFAIRNSFAPRVVVVVPRGDGLVAVLTNDTDEAWTGAAEFARLRFDGEVMHSDTREVTVPARGTLSVAVPVDVATATNIADELVTVRALGERGLWWFAEPRDSALPAPKLHASVRLRADATFEATVRADVLVRDLTLLLDKLGSEATVDRGLVTLLPGESATFVIRGLSELTASDLLDDRVARSGNQLVTR